MEILTTLTVWTFPLNLYSYGKSSLKILVQHFKEFQFLKSLDTPSQAQK
jgi:hypothetical protein